MARLKEEYKKDIMPDLKKKLKYKNLYEVPRLEKIVINMGIGEALQDAKILDQAALDLANITGQHPVITRAKKAIAAFKLAKGKPIGLKVTLRRNKMYEFLDRLINCSIPRIRDFRGISADSFDAHGNYSFGISEHTIFPEISYDKTKHILGMDITLCIRCKKPIDSIELLKAFNFPFKK